MLFTVRPGLRLQLSVIRELQEESKCYCAETTESEARSVLGQSRRVAAVVPLSVKCSQGRCDKEQI